MTRTRFHQRLRTLLSAASLYPLVISQLLAMSGPPTAPVHLERAVAAWGTPMPGPARGASEGGPRDYHAVVVRLRAQADLDGLPRRPRRAHRWAVVERLHEVADRTQASLLAFLESARGRGDVREVRPLWVVNAVALQATPALLRDLTHRPEIAEISPDTVLTAPAPVPAPSLRTVAPEPGLDQIRAPELWAVGPRGAGVVVAAVDTGVDASHPDLAARWRGGANSWYDPYGQHPSPADMNGHGTQTTGIMVGGDSGGTAIGVAPDARWIAAKAFNDAGTATTSALHAVFQWLLDPDLDPATDDAPDVVNASWAFGAKGCNLAFEPDLAALRAIGILPVFAAGNGGPAAGTSYSPANNPSALAVGAVGGDGRIASFSSRGPTSCGSGTRVFPDLVAPGTDVWTSDLFGLWTTATGTSVAAPHVAGVLALLLSGKPGRTAEQQAVAIRVSGADLGAAGTDDTYGAGRVDALAAWNALP